MGKAASTLGKVGKMGAGAALGGPAGAGAAGAEIGAEAAMGAAGGGGGILSSIGQSISGKLKSMLPNIAKGQIGGAGAQIPQDSSPAARPPMQENQEIQQSQATPVGIPNGLNPQEQQDMFQNRWKKYYQ